VSIISIKVSSILRDVYSTYPLYDFLVLLINLSMKAKEHTLTKRV